MLLPSVLFADPAGAVRIIDADTWDVGGERVRLFGIDAPEAAQTCQRNDGTAWACGRWATAEVDRRYGGRQALCERLDRDRYGRSVARCHIDGVDVARQMVRDGLSFAYRKYSMDYDLDEKGAAQSGRGLHGTVVQAPAAYRAAQRSRAAATSVSGCTIKGNISSRGVRIYHVSGQHHYRRTKIDTTKGERWFCSAAEARAAGWRAARR